MILQHRLLLRLCRRCEMPSYRVRVNRLRIRRVLILKNNSKNKTRTRYRPVRKRFQRNPYSVTNIDDVWECDLVEVQGLSKYNDGVRYLLTVIDVFFKFLHIVPLSSKKGKTVTTAFQSIFKDQKYLRRIRRRPVWVRTDKGEEFLNRSFQDMLRREGIRFQNCKNPNVECSVVERAHRTIRDKLYKYFTYKNMYRFVGVFPDFVIGYNSTVHSTTGMPPALVTDSDVLAIWKKMKEKRSRIHIARPKVHVVQHVRISRENDICQRRRAESHHGDISNYQGNRRTPRHVYELEDLNGKVIEGQFYGEKLTPVRNLKRTQFQIGKILRTRVRRGIREYLVRRKGYRPDFDSWIND